MTCWVNKKRGRIITADSEYKNRKRNQHEDDYKKKTEASGRSRRARAALADDGTERDKLTHLVKKRGRG